MAKEETGVSVGIVLVILVMFLGFCFGNIFQIYVWHKYLVDEGLAEYNNKTGAWQMIVKVDHEKNK